MEEAGCVIREIVPICSFFAHPARSSEKSHLFCGRVDARGIGGVHGLRDEGEDIRVLPMRCNLAFALLKAGRVNSAWPLIALQWLSKNRAALRRRWRESPR
jgi:ADP-ribose pyrophosphatase